MISVLKSFLLFCILSSIVLAQTTDVKWNNASFQKIPKKIATHDSPARNLTVDSMFIFQSGPQFNTNILWRGMYDSNDSNIEGKLLLLNSSSLSIIDTNSDFDSGVASDDMQMVATLDGSITAVVTQNDDDNNTQIVCHTIIGGEGPPISYTITNNTDPNTTYRIETLIVNASAPYLVYSKTVNQSEVVLYAGAINITEKALTNVRILTYGPCSNVKCDTYLDPLGVLCLFRANSSIWASLLTRESPRLQFLKSDNSSSPNDIPVRYYPEAVISTLSYTVGILSAWRNDAVFLLVQNFDFGSEDRIRSNQSIAVKNFGINNVVQNPFIGGVAFHDDIALFYTSYDDSRAQNWYYAGYDRDGVPTHLETLLANVEPNSFSRLKIAKDAGTEAVSVAAYVSVLPNSTAIFYGQVLNQMSE